MPDMNTFTVAAATTPTVISVGLSHHLTKKKHRGKPTYHIGYHQGLELVRSFLIYASHRTVEELQSFTAQYVPVPTWVHVEEATIENKWLEEAAEHLVAQLGPDGVERVGGKRWWRWRVKELKAEWIEMRRHYYDRLKHTDWAPRTIMYIHGAYFFGSVDEHRYQLQRHARKMKARVFAPRYRLAPQFPFPCGLLDILASYLFLLSQQPASTIILSGDSAGGGAVVALLCILRDQNIPLPAGSILISPWVDLTHSFPSVISDNSGDYIPAHGFLHKSSPAWPPPTDEDIEKAIDEIEREQKPPASSLSANFREQLKFMKPSKDLKEEAQGFDIVSPVSDTNQGISTSAVPTKGVITVMIDDHEVRIKDQIQLYTTNELLNHPLVSPVLQGSLGGLPPMLVLVGGSEVLRDEQIYLAHKAANPRKYPPPEHVSTAQQLAALNRWKHGTDVVLQVFDDCCHVTPTLSFTKPAKYMYRSIARFGDWLFAREALAKANTQPSQNIPDTALLDSIENDGLDGTFDPHGKLFSEAGARIVKSDTMSIISSSSSSSSSNEEDSTESQSSGSHIARKLSTAAPVYDIPKFSNHMVRQRVDKRGNVFALSPASNLPAMQVPLQDIGCIKPEPVRRWMDGKKQWDSKYAKAKKRVQMQRAKEIAEGGYLAFEDDGSGIVEKPPPSALAGRRKREDEVVPGRSFKPSYGLKLWSLIGSKQDSKTIKAENRVDGNVETPPNEAAAPGGDHLSTSSGEDETTPDITRSRSQINRGEAISTVPDAELVDSPPPKVDVTEPYEKLGQQEGKDSKGKGIEVKT